MKILLLVSLLLSGCSASKPTGKMDNRSFENISTFFSTEVFEMVKNFILTKGDRKTYRNFDNRNPHYSFVQFEVFLGSDIGQQNINNNPELSDFNQMTIVERNGTVRYYEMIIVRPGDIEKRKAWIQKGMKEGEVYLVDVYGQGLDKMKGDIMGLLRMLQEETKGE